MSDAKRKLVTYHEAGLAVGVALMNAFDVMTGISSVPGGTAGSTTRSSPITGPASRSSGPW